jgi:rod shape-determining protein MreD
MRGKILLGVAAAVVIVLTLHTTVFDRISIWGSKPDLLLAIVVYVSLLKGPVAGTIAGFVLGVLQDAQSHHSLGLNAASKALIGYAASHTWEGLDKESAYTQMAVIFGAGLLHNLVFYILYSGSQVGMVPGLMIKAGVPGALYTAVAAPVLMALVGHLFGCRMELSAVSKRQR